MDVEITCGCGAYLEVVDVTPLQFEHALERWTALHPHSDARAEQKVANVQEVLREQMKPDGDE